MKDEQRVFESRTAFGKWLDKNYRTSTGLWLVFGKGGRLKTLSADEALEEALCHGWIDGQLRSLGADRYVKRFTPRRKGSVWSERNRNLALKLIEAGAMEASGRAAIAQARECGTWDRPKPKPVAEAEIGILTEALSGHEKALANFLKMSPSVRRTYTKFYLATRNEDTRKKRLERIVGRLNENKKPM